MDPHLIETMQRCAQRLVDRLEVAVRETSESAQSLAFRATVAAALDEAMDSLVSTEIWGPPNRPASNYFWDMAQPYLQHGQLQVRARTKPRGYAGDFLLLSQICEWTCCDHPIGNAMDHYFQNQAAPQAVRYRTDRVAQRIADRLAGVGTAAMHVVAVGSGPALEVVRAAIKSDAAGRDRLRVTLLDLDQQALDWAEKHLLALIPRQNVKAVRTNLARLAHFPQLAEEMKPADFVCCPGFFDYLDDGAAEAMLQLFCDSLSSSGELIVYNFAPTNPSRAYMEWIGNWYLTYRDTSDMKRLANHLRTDHSIEAKSVSNDTLVELVIGRQR